ncbi:MAG: HmuY family protein [Bacteroidota bacterium]
MKKLYFLLVLLLATIQVNAQNEPCYEVVQSPGYANNVFVDLSTGTQTTLPIDNWEIAFGVGPFAFGIFVNEAAISSFSNPQPAPQLFLSGNNDFATADTMEIVTQLYNNEASWDAGAFNLIPNPENDFDLGWGTYNFMSNVVSGTRVYFIQLRDETYRKLEIQSLISGVYTGRHANLDGSDEVNFTIDKANFSGKNLAYYSITDNEVRDLEPNSWHLLFTRYNTPLPFGGPGEVIYYTVTGVLHNNGITVAEAAGVDPETVDYQDYLDQFQDTLNTIGDDWKNFNGSEFTVADDLVYFVQTAEDTVYQLQFIDFTGASQGISTLCVNEAGVISSVSELPSQLTSAQLYPNPATEFIRLEFEFNNTNFSTEPQLNIFNNTGQLVLQQRVQQLRVGHNQLDVPLNLVAGHYYLQLILGREQFTQTFIVR